MSKPLEPEDEGEPLEPEGMPQAPEELEPAPPDAPDYLERSSRAYHGLMLLERGISVLLLIAVFGVVLAQVITRYVFSNPLPWTEEIARYLLVWLTFVAAGYVTSRRQHITVDLLVARLGRAGAVIVDTFAVLVVLVVAAVLAVAAITAGQGSSDLRSPASGLPMSVVYIGGLVGFGLIILHSLLNLYVNLRHPEHVPGAMENIEKESA